MVIRTIKSFSLAFASLVFVWRGAVAQRQLPPWERGMMDIHHISTGRGNAAYMVFPDGTTLLFDAGEISETHTRTTSPRNSQLKPNNSRSAYEWIADYITQFAPGKATPILDYAVISHFHDDHFGEWDTLKVKSSKGNYVKTGITGVADRIPVRRLIDRGHHWPIDLSGMEFQRRFEKDEYHITQTLHNYFEFIESMGARNMRYDSLVVGSGQQIRLVHQPDSFPTWKVQNIAGGGRVATGYADKESFTVYPMGVYPGENPLSICLKFSYGRFDYFTGGDISGMDELGSPDFQAMEALIGPVVGAVDVATLNHHGNRDSQSPYYVRTLRPRIWIQQTWSSDHPGHDVLRRIGSTSLYPGPRAIFATDLLPANVNVLGEHIVESLVTARAGHVVVRVEPGGDRYWVYVLNDSTEKRAIVSEHGPYTSR